MPTDRTPQEWAVFLAREIMGWTHDGGFWFRTQDCSQGTFNPYGNLYHAREVLDKIVEILPPDISSVQEYKISSYGNRFDVSLPWRGLWGSAPGPHEGPAICLLAEKVMESIK